MFLVVLSACKPEKVAEPFRPSDRHDAYIHSLRLAGLGGAALTRDWIKVSTDVLLQPVSIETPYEEVFYADPKEAFAAAFRFSARKGQKIVVEITHQGLQPGRLFMDLFRVREGTFQNWQKVASSGYREWRLEFEPRRDYDYVFRFQPELLRGGTYRVVFQREASLLFPVPDKDSRAIQSRFGAERDGGTREHHGVDIFAARHTPVIAPSRASVQRVTESEIGGRTIWLYDTKRSLSMYFAH
ncbi:MAG: M23 family metallopeptidase, partial [Candidatus Aminicenantes bacterium]|nr:M23 family metallopeptidase [Candidatus Aminicenantes bacterium]